MTFKALLVFAIAVETRGAVNNWPPKQLQELMDNCRQTEHPEELLGLLSRKYFDRYLKDWGVEET